MSPKTHDPYEALRYGEYRWFLAGVMAMFMGFQIQSLVMGWQVYEITRDPLALGLIGLAEAIPFLGLTLFGGYAADRRDRRNLSLISMVVLFLGALVLVALTFRENLRMAWPFYAIQAMAGVGRAFYRPASQALGTELVPREAYQNASTWRSTVFHLAMVIGPAAGGLLYGFGSARLAYSVEACLMAFSLFSLSRIRPRPRQASGSASVLTSLAEGVRFVFAKKLILSALSLDLFAVLFGGAIAMLPAFASEILKVGPQGLGILRAAPAVGSVAMSFVLAHRPPLQHAGRTLLWCVAAFGVCWIAFAYSKTFVLSLVLLAASGAFDNVSVVLRGTLVQTCTPPEMMGRVQAVNSFFIGSSNELGSFESGLAAKYLGLVPSVVLGGIMTLATVGFTAWKVPELRRLKQIQD
ncbi:MAG: MFS transporter [Holophaga sp.]|nr:MFS transporter [Holophaga sp.]